MIVSDCLELDVKNKLKLHLFHMQTCVALYLTMREISDAVAFMCILRFFKRVDPATAMAGIQSQPFSLTVAHVARKE